MALIKITLIFLAFCGVSFGAVYRVGNSNSWTSRRLVDYNEWASTKDFHVGDTLIFAYSNQFHNVMQVANQDFESCNINSPLITYTSGSDTVTLKRPGHMYFLCGAPSHCQEGQKVDVKVTLPIPTDSSASPSPAPGSSSPSASHSEVITQSGAPTLHSWTLELVATSLVVLCILSLIFVDF